MAKLKEVVSFLNKYLDIKSIKDNSYNGLQVRGNLEVNKIAFCVDASVENFKKAASAGANLIIVHHGLSWRKKNPLVMNLLNKERNKVLKENNISLYTAHLPLDRHKEVGNNAELLKLLGAKISGEFALNDGKNIGWIGKIGEGISVVEIERILNKELKTKCNCLFFGKKNIKTIAVCSGGGGFPLFFEALSKKVDLYLTGEANDIFSAAKDAKMNVIFAGHYATETVGIKALMTKVSKEFDAECEFIDTPTGL